MKTSHITFLIFILGIVVYFRIFFNGFVGDDIGYINHPYIQNFEILKLFQSSSSDLGGHSLVTGNFYRPLMLVLFSVIYKLFGQTSFFYHLPQLIFHIANSILVLFVLKKFLSKKISAILSIIFLVHPINIEAVAYISDLQDVMFVFFGLLALLLTLYKSFSKYNIYLVGFLLFLSLLSKETGILFVGIITSIPLLLKEKNKNRFLPVIIVLIISYAFLRFVIAGVGIGETPQSVFFNLSLLQRIENIPYIFYYYIKTFIFPLKLAVGQAWAIQHSNFSQTILFAFLAILGLIFALLLRYKKAKKFNVYLFFLIWFFGGFGIHSQIIPLEMTVADRWFYFPIIGLLGIIGLCIESIKNKKIKVAITILILITIPFLILRTFIRLGDWQSPLILYKNDAQITKSYLLENSLGYAYMQENNMKEASIHLSRSIDYYMSPNNTNTLGVYYYKIGDNEKAQEWFEKSITISPNFLAFNNLVNLLIEKKDYGKAQKYLLQATKKIPDNENFWFMLAVTSYKNNDLPTALNASEKAYLINPSERNNYIVTTLRTGNILKIND